MSALSTVERAFVRRLGPLRADGRRLNEGRKIAVRRGRNLTTGQAQCEVDLGETRALSQVSATTAVPHADRANEGVLRVNVVLSPMARADWDPALARGGSSAVGKANSYVTTVIEHALLETRAVDLEGLCIVAGRKVWAIQVDVHILNDGGNVIDAGVLSALGALSHFRRPDVSVTGDSVHVFSLEEREPVPLSIHHTPFCVTFSLFHRSSAEAEADGDDATRFFLLDPTDREELARDGQITIIVNSHSEICGVHKHGWPPLSSEQISHLVSLAVERVPTLAECIADN
mmetsp:Transcript_24544/g.69299  ORF Transcript_24544/g.69299 Transcript_24544/m.69299 type:complete len:288 (-) Transcript_24544:256-1119(-)